MAMNERKHNELMDAINVAFKSIGNVAPTKPPRSKDNHGPIAWELFVARHLEAISKARCNVAKREAIHAQIIPDTDKEPKKPGFNQMIYTGDQVGIWLEVREPGTRVDCVRLCAFLKERKVSQKVIDEAVAYATVENKPAHVFRTSLVTEQAD